MNYYTTSILTYIWIWNNRDIVFKLVIPNLILITLATLLVQIFPSYSGLLIPVYVFGLWLFSSTMVQLHRFILLNLNKETIKFVSTPTKQDFNYVGLWILLSIFDRLGEQITTSILETTYPLMFQLFLIAVLLSLSYYILTRAYMIFPAISIGKSLHDGWALTSRSENIRLVFLTTLILLIPLIIFLMFFIWMSVNFLPEEFFILFYLFLFVLSLLIINTHYSLLFRSLTNN